MSSMTGPVASPPTTYRLATALAVRLVGRGLVALALLVIVATGACVVAGVGGVPIGVVALAGTALTATGAWFLLRRAWAVRLTRQGYAVRLLGGIGAVR